MATISPDRIPDTVRNNLINDLSNPNNCTCGWYLFTSSVCGHQFQRYPHCCGETTTKSGQSGFYKSPARNITLTLRESMLPAEGAKDRITVRSVYFFIRNTALICSGRMQGHMLDGLDSMSNEALRGHRVWNGWIFSMRLRVGGPREQVQRRPRDNLNFLIAEDYSLFNLFPLYTSNRYYIFDFVGSVSPASDESKTLITALPHTFLASMSSNTLEISCSPLYAWSYTTGLIDPSSAILSNSAQIWAVSPGFLRLCSPNRFI
jgi:hypothetical protein